MLLLNQFASTGILINSMDNELVFQNKLVFHVKIYLLANNFT